MDCGSGRCLDRRGMLSGGVTSRTGEPAWRARPWVPGRGAVGRHESGGPHQSGKVPSGVEVPAAEPSRGPYPEEQPGTGGSHPSGRRDAGPDAEASRTEPAVRGPQPGRVLDHHIQGSGHLAREPHHAPGRCPHRHSGHRGVLQAPVSPAPEAPGGSVAVDNGGAHRGEQARARRGCWRVHGTRQQARQRARSADQQTAEQPHG